MSRKLWAWITGLIVLFLMMGVIQEKGYMKLTSGLQTVDLDKSESTCLPNAMPESGQFFYSCSLKFVNRGKEKVSFSVNVRPGDKGLRRQLGEEAVLGGTAAGQARQVIDLDGGQSKNVPVILMTNIHKGAFAELPDLLEASDLVLYTAEDVKVIPPIQK
ncbi:hypothetical protein [Bacillus marinisedimentorum]|uniref:hypothetical protein n=1 Tax=Bacillus marinisedimentorum TaxID=1821260 RepID=UPI000872A9B2|nr:hypothetical protein [Bacillus marinisedimentorum]